MCGARAAQIFVRALLAHRAVVRATGVIPPVTTELRTSAPLSRYTRGELGLRVLLVAVVLNILAIVATGRYLAAFLSCFGFFAWWGCADLAAHIFSLARPAWASVARGVQVEPTTSGPTYALDDAWGAAAGARLDPCVLPQDARQGRMPRCGARLALRTVLQVPRAWRQLHAARNAIPRNGRVVSVTCTGT